MPCIGRCWLLGASPPQSAQCSGGLSPGPFCVEFACSPRVHKGFPPLITPTEHSCPRRTVHLVPGRLQAAHCVCVCVSCVTSINARVCCSVSCVPLKPDNYY